MTTASDEIRLREAGKAVETTALPESLRGQERTCASSLPLPSGTALVPVTERARAAAAVAVRAGAKAAELADRPGSLVHAQPPTFAQAHARHHERARRHETAAVRHLLLVYGYTHMVFVKSVLNALEWVTETPLRALGAAVLILIIWLWS
jgi:hypothetical protein